MARRIEIEHKDGRRYAVEPRDFHKLYEPMGFTATVYEGDGGEPYVAPEKRAKADAEKSE